MHFWPLLGRLGGEEGLQHSAQKTVREEQAFIKAMKERVRNHNENPLTCRLAGEDLKNLVTTVSKREEDRCRISLGPKEQFVMADRWAESTGAPLDGSLVVENVSWKD